MRSSRLAPLIAQQRLLVAGPLLPARPVRLNVVLPRHGEEEGRAAPPPLELRVATPPLLLLLLLQGDTGCLEEKEHREERARDSLWKERGHAMAGGTPGGRREQGP